ncbi:hypothetical protein [Lactobacillus helveticus]|uniref:Uncharacterized protein n=1 Tax=Lactobacillus helveticus CIRM-BIA 104 TaxID=1226333 RepID=U6FDA4_LACHE|nr:hypothetical protein [Lactobacillus helveticus]KXN77887.1 hypothetical protein AY470_01275 [Lactobacillus helveticus]MCT3424721.1 hypothetical protein [Lactobacillus helveticus]CDI61274.1 Putative uncharacterized protein [Lactobacillus helveticus CIRM-BIA 104]
MYLFNPKRFKGSLSLTEKDMTLLQLICRFGFVNDSQLDMLYSVVQHYPTRFFHPILLKWTQYSGLLQKRKKPRIITSTSVIRNVYIPTKICRSFLNENGFVLGDDPLVAVNSHNEQAIEVVVQSLYSAMFKASIYVPYSAYLASTTGYKLLMNPEMSVEFMDSDNTTQKNRILLDPEGFRLPDTFIQKNQIWNPEVAPRNSKPALSSSVPTYSLRKHYSFIRSISTAPIDKQLSLITTSTYMSLLDGGIDSNDLSILGNNYSLLFIGNKDYLSINDNKTSSSSKYKNAVNDKAKEAEGEAIESSYLDKESDFKVSGSIIDESGKPRDSKKQGRLNGFLNDFSELSNGSEDKPSGRDAHLGEKGSKSASKAKKEKKDNQFINDSQAELDKLLAGVDAKDNMVSPSGDSLGTKKSANSTNGASGYPMGDTLGTKISANSINGIRKSPGGDTLGTKISANSINGIRKSPGGDTLGSQNKKGFIYRLSGVSSPIQITNTQDFKKNPNYSANSALMNLKLISASAASEKPVDAFRYPTANPDNLLRNINLISNPAFEPALLDTSSFKNQYKYQQYTFVADEVVSFSRNGRRQEIFVEQDNRTESNNTQIQKILNYISYALEHPQRDILLMISITDGSLSSPKVPKYTNIGRKLASLSSKFLKSYLSDENGERIFLSQMYKQANNLKIVLSGVSESQIDLTQFLLGSNYSMDYYQTIQKYVAEINKNSTQWNANLKLSKEFSTIIHDPELATQPLDKLSGLNENSPAKGLWRYTDTMYVSPILGTIHYRNKLSRQRYNQPVIIGDEHSLDTVIQTLELVNRANTVKDTCPPVVIYPHRERPVTAITLNQYRDLYNWLPTWRPTIPVLIQPLTGLKDNLQLHKELRWLTIQYDLDIYNYFKIGAINKFALKKHPDYGNEYITPLKWSTNTKARSYDELHKLALKMKKKEFVDQLKLNEIPLGLFKTVLERWPKGIYDLPLIEKLPYIDLDQEQPTILEEESILNHLYAPNSVIPSSRIQLQFHNDN